MEKINVKIIIDQQTNKFVEVTIDKNAKLRDLLSEASKSENMKGISHFKVVLPDWNLVGPESLDKKLNELGFEDQSKSYISSYTLDSNKKADDKNKWEGWIDLKSISLSQDKKNEDAEKNEDDSITLIIFKFSTKVTRLNVTKNTTMKDIKEQLQQKCDLSDERIDELDLFYDGDNIFSDLSKTVEQIFDKNEIKEREVKAQARDFDFNLKKSNLKKSENEASNGECDIFLLIHDSNNNEIKHMVTANPNTTLINLIKDKWEIFKDFSEGFIIAFRGIIRSDLNNELRLQEGDLINIYPHDNPMCKQNENKLIKIEDLKSDRNKNNNGNYVSKTDPANKNNWPLSKIIVGVIDLILLAAAITTFVLDVYLAIPIVLTVLFVIDTVLFLVWDYISPESWRKPPKNIKTEFNTEESSEFKQDRGSEITKNDLKTEKKEPDGNNLQK